jgi:hypothetical protein
MTAAERKEAAAAEERAAAQAEAAAALRKALGNWVPVSVK